MKKYLRVALGGITAGVVASSGVQAQMVTGPSSSQSPYVVPEATGVKVTSILTAGDVIGGYKMTGIPDGTGAFDNGDGTFTWLVNHEIGNTGGAVRAHGSIGAFVSKWIVRKSDFAVLGGGDLIQRVMLWNTATSSYVPYSTTSPSSSAAFGRFCSADLPAVSAFYNSATGKGTQERIFMNGEESGTEGRGFAHIATGPNAGTSYELPRLGKFSWENSMANPGTGDKTVVAGTDDATPGQVYFYIGTKTSTGNEIEKAGLSNGKLYAPAVTGMLTETSSSIPAVASFTMIDLGNVANMTGATLQTNSNNGGVTQFLRPEDGAWDPQNPTDFYFVTTNSFSSPSRLWRMRFNNINDLSLGGTITAVLDGTEGQKMLDNMTIDNWGHILMVEDVGGNAHLGKTWQYDIASDSLKLIASHDTARFLSGASKYLTIDEEATGIIDAQEILGAGWFLMADQAHYSVPGEQYEGGQLLALYNPDSYNANPEIGFEGNGKNINNGSLIPAASDYTDFGTVDTGSKVTRVFYVKNTGAAKLNVKEVKFTGANAGDFSLVSAPAFPANINSGDSLKLTVQFAPMVVGYRSATINISSNDFDEKAFTAALQGVALNNRTAIDEAALASGITLFPNPTSNETTIAMELSKSERFVVSVFDMQGKEVLQSIDKVLPAGQQQIVLNTSVLTNGIYFVQVASETQRMKIKLVVMH